ncbi:phosphopantetheine-binding protein [Methylocaldum sp. MU1018]
MISQLTPMELEVSRMIVESLNLEAAPEHIEPEKPLYRDGLGLDSIDLLELSLVISKKYGFQVKSDDPEVTNIFSSLRALAGTIEKRRVK